MAIVNAICCCFSSNGGSILSSMKPTFVMVLAQIMFAGINICYALAAQNGMDLRVLVAYRFAFGAAFLIPIAFFSERNRRSQMTWKVFIYAFLCGIFSGSLGQNLFLSSLAYTSATYAAAMTNLIPIFTFIVSVCLRLERLRLHTMDGKAKMLGTLIGIGGAMLFTFYKGPEFVLWKTNINLTKLVTNHSTKQIGGGRHDFAFGMTLAMLSCICYSLWFVIQAKVAAIYPYPQSFTALMLVLATIQSTIVAACIQHDWKEWKLGFNIRLLTVLYAGIIGSGIMFSMISYCIRVRGPLFGSIFNPLMLVLVALGGSLFMEEKLCLGRILGAVIIICGLYFVLWGKSREMRQQNRLMPENIEMGQQHPENREIRQHNLENRELRQQNRMTPENIEMRQQNRITTENIEMRQQNPENPENREMRQPNPENREMRQHNRITPENDPSKDPVEEP